MRQNRSFALLGVCLALLLAVFGAASAFAQPSASEGPSAAESPSAPEGGNEYSLTQGWYQGRSTYYYNFDNAIPSSDGGVTVDTAPIYVLFHENGSVVAGQYNIVDVIPGEAGYSDLWQVHMVEVPNDYVANTATSYADLVSASYPITPTSTYVNCPIVPAGSTLQYSQQGLVQGWHDDNPIYYFDFGLNLEETAPIYVFFYDDGMSVPDQRNIIDVIPGDAGYSAFWRVHMVTVPDDYVANSATSLADIQTAGYTITPTTMLVNCPVVRTEETAQVFDKTTGWYQDSSVSYYNFNNPVPSPDGGATVTPAPIYVLFFDDGSPVPGQHNIIDVVPDDMGYSDLWQVHAVTVPDDYVADTIRSYAQIAAGGYTVTPMDVFVNCPVVPEGSVLSGNEMGTTAGWYRGQEVFYFDFGMNPQETAPIYAFFYDDGSPVAGQSNIIDTIPTDPDYSAFWQVHMVTVPDDYVPDSIRSEADLLTAGFPIQATDMIVNCPVVLPPTDVSLTGFGGESGGSAVSLALTLFSGAAVAAVFFYKRRRVAEVEMG